MSRVPSVLNVSRDGQEVNGSLIDRLCGQISAFMTDVYTGFNRGLSLTENTNSDIRKVTFRTPNAFHSLPVRTHRATLVAGTVTVTSPLVTAGLSVDVSRVSGTAANFGFLSYTASAGSITINSTNAADDSVVLWAITPSPPHLWQEVRFRTELKGRANGVLVLKAVVVGVSSPILEPVLVTGWRQEEPEIVLTYVTGLNPGVNYELTLLVI